MKKITLIMVCALLIVFFVAFNYLLWERQAWEEDIQNLRSANVYSASQIKASEQKTKELENENEALEQTISQLLEEKARLEEDKEKADQEISGLKSELDAKNLMASRLVALVDLKVFEKPVLKWVEAINKGEYEKAFLMLDFEEKQVEGPFTAPMVFEESFKSNVKSIAVKDIELREEENAAGALGEIVLKVTLEVNLLKDRQGSPFFLSEGPNERYFKLDCGENAEEWVITEIFQ